MNKFYNLYCVSYYSLLRSNLSVEQIIEFNKQQGLDYAVLLDNNLSAAIDFYHLCLKHHLKPVIGLDWNYYQSHYLLIAKNNLGYHELLKIESFTNLEHDFNPNNYVSNLIVIHLSGKEIIDRTKHDDYYNQQVLALNCARCLNQQQLSILDVLECIKNDCLLINLTNSSLNSHDYLLTYEQAKQYYNDEQINLTTEIIEKCAWTIDDYKIKLAHFPINKKFKSAKQYLENCCLVGLKNKLCNENSLIDKKYIDRLNYELDVIHSMGYDNYFLIVSDFVNWAKDHQILIGPGRGSAAGSLVAYCMNITNIDPIKYHLIFERFLNVDRKTLPDIDIDVMDTKRQELIDYIFEKYGVENTSYIATYQRIKAKMAIRDVGRILDIDLKIIDKISKRLTSDMEENLDLVQEDSKLKEYYDTYEKLFYYAKQLINIPRQISTHAAGIIIADQALWNYLPVTKGIDGWQLSEFTMDYLESLGLFKMDILGLKNLSIIDEVIHLINLKQKTKIDLDKINLNDLNLFNDLCNGNTIGIFQLESPGMKNTIMKIKPQSIEDISICSALFRPGPQSLIPDYVKTRNKQLEPKYLNEQIKTILEPTLGFCIYQEQVIELIKAITNFSTSQADIFRRAISKKKEDLFIKMRKEFIDAAIKNHYDEKQANEIYDFILEFANYGFNHSHSLAYSYISYQMMYLKYYYPLEFFCVLLRHGDAAKNNLYISEAKKKNIQIANVNICYSQDNFSIYNHQIMFGFSNIKGFGIEITKKLLDIRNQYEFIDYCQIIAILARNNISQKVIEVLIKTGAFDHFNVDRNFLLINLDEMINKANIFKNDKPVFDLVLNQDYEPMSEQEKAMYEYQYLNYAFSNNQYEQLFNQYKEQYHLKTINENNAPDANYLIQIKQLKQTMTKYNKKMCFIEFNQDDVGYNCASFNSELFSQLKVNEYYIVNLKISNENKLQLTKVIECINKE